jgi:aryl-alcohol dehydrogenase-like predicted oxidoreductase
MTPSLLQGFATPEGTGGYAARLEQEAHPDQFRPLDACRVSSLGIGTYLGREDAETDAAYHGALTRALTGGVNAVDTAINYRHQRSERVIGQAVAALVAKGSVRREELVIATKGGFLPFDGAVPSDPAAYVAHTYLDPGILRPTDLVAGCHCMTPGFLRDQMDRSRRNLGLETIDVYYIHNPEMQLAEVDRPEFRRRIRAAFAALEEAVTAGAIRRYGTATWNGYRQPAGAPDHLELAELTDVAREAGGPDHHFRVIQLPYNLAMAEAFTRANQRVGDETVSLLEAARRLGIYVMTSASLYQGQLAQKLPPVVGEFLPGLTTDAQRALEFVRSTPGVGTALCGMKQVGHVEENLALVRRAPVPWAQFQRLFSPV